MKTDTRITAYTRAISEMRQDHFDAPIPISQNDDGIDKIGYELKQLRTYIEEKSKTLDQLIQISEATKRANQGTLLEDTLDHIFSSFRALIPYNRIGMAMLKSNDIIQSAWIGADYPELHLKPGFSAPLQGSSLQSIIATGKPRIINDLQEHLHQHPSSRATKLMLQEGILSNLTCPLIANGKPIGFLFFSSTQANTYEHAHVHLFLQIANHLSHTIEKNILYQQLLELTDFKDHLLQVLSHDLNTPLSAIALGLDLLTHNQLSQSEQSDIYQEMQASCHNTQTILRSLLSFQQLNASPTPPKPLDLSAYFTQYVPTATLMLRPKSQTLQTHIDPDLPAVNCQPHHLSQILNNLISNAAKYSPLHATISLRAAQTDQRIVISIQDQGEGIPLEEIPLLFRPFSTTSTQPTSGEAQHGLGLAITRRIIEALGERIWVQSTPQEGTTFFFSLQPHTP